MKIEQYYREARENKWFRYFTTFCRILLAWGFLPSGLVKIMGQRFTSLSSNHPMGQYLDALYHTGYYYTVIGVLQVVAAILLLIPRTALLGALIYLPIIFNICLLSFSVRFDGSILTTPLMVLTNLYLIAWDYDRIKYVLPFYKPQKTNDANVNSSSNHRFPFAFFGAAVAVLILTAFTIFNLYEIRPRNTLNECRAQCEDSANKQACEEFCDCIHQQGTPLNPCLEQYENSRELP